MLYRRIIVSSIATLLASSANTATAQSDRTVTMEDAIKVAVNSNPQVAQAQYNKEAIQFERKRAQGLKAPRLDFEGTGGYEHLDNPTRRAIGLGNQSLYPVQAELNADWKVFDFGRRRGELLRQAARVDGASLRVAERSEFIALQVARQYLNVLLQQRVVAASEDNVTFHQQLASDLSTGVKQGSISIADLQQAQERLQAALVNESEAKQSLTEAEITLRSLTGLDISQVEMPPTLAAKMPTSLNDAVGLARTDNPKVKEASADVDAAHSYAKSVKAEQYPTIGVQVIGRLGRDVDGFKGETKDVIARGYLRWNIFDGGINRANYQEAVRRASESRYKLYELAREAEEDVRKAWTTLQTQTTLVEQLTKQSQVSDDLILSYRAQFNVGRRSLLDVLDAQNSRYNVEVRLETARFSEMFARYQTLAATDRFLSALGVAPGAGAGANERERFNYGPSKPAELEYRKLPK